MRFWVPAFLALLVAYGCGAVRPLSKADADRTQVIQARIAEARRMGAMECAPKKLAEAEARLEYARHEAREFHERERVTAWFEEARRAADELLAQTRRCLEARKPPPPPPDSDRDGVPDTRDRCPGTPLNVSVGADGCPRDADSDGVADYLDRCPGTPPGVAVDAQGCPPDSDGDGVADHMDRCPDTPAGVKVDPDGCPLDSDSDGVADYADRCPGTLPGVPVDTRGCPLDTDGDGVADHEDRCPDTPRGAPVDRLGCLRDADGDGLPDWDEIRKYATNPNDPDSDDDGLRDGDEVLRYRTNPNNADTDGDDLADGDEVLRYGTDPNRRDTDGGSVSDGVEVKVSGTNPLDPDDDVKQVKAVELHILFDVNSAEIRRADYAQIEEIARFLKQYPDLVLTVEGHTDNTGSPGYNMELSLRRAQAVVRLLNERYGIPLERMKAVGYGPSRPVAPNDTAEGRAKNRRVYAVLTAE